MKNYRAILDRIYQDKNPEKINSIPSLLEKYQGHEEELLSEICKKFAIKKEDYSQEPLNSEVANIDIIEAALSTSGSVKEKRTTSSKWLILAIIGASVTVVVLVSVFVFGSKSKSEEENTIESFEDLSSKKNSDERINVIEAEKKIEEVLPEIKVQLFARTGIFYDSEGWPMEIGKMYEVVNFQDSKNYKKKSEYDQIDKILIEGESEDIYIEVYDNLENKVIYTKEGFNLQGQLLFTHPAPLSEQDKNYAEWLNWRWHPDITLFVKYKGEIIFEGKIIQ